MFMFSSLFLALAVCLSTEKRIPKQERSTEPAERWKCVRHCRWKKARARGSSRWRRRGGGQSKEDCQVICLLFAFLSLINNCTEGFGTVEKLHDILTWYCSKDQNQTFSSCCCRTYIRGAVINYSGVRQVFAFVKQLERSNDWSRPGHRASTVGQWERSCRAPSSS